MATLDAALSKKIMALPARERAKLVQKLLASLDQEPILTTAEVDRLWEKEILHRKAAFEAGKVKGIPLQQFLKRLRTKTAALSKKAS